MSPLKLLLGKVFWVFWGMVCVFVTYLLCLGVDRDLARNYPLYKRFKVWVSQPDFIAKTLLFCLYLFWGGFIVWGFLTSLTPYSR